MFDTVKGMKSSVKSSTAPSNVSKSAKKSQKVVKDASTLNGQAALLMQSLNKFYADSRHVNTLLAYISTKCGPGNVSLRILDWLLTNYARKHNVSYTLDTTKGPSVFNIHLDYKRQLKAHSKKRFDPFCRNERITYKTNGKVFETTVGQLNFFKWAIKNRVLQYARDHQERIEADMNSAAKKARTKSSTAKSSGKKQLAISASRSVDKKNVTVTVKFNTKK